MGHRAYYPAYDRWEGSLQENFEMFINPLLDDELSRRIYLGDLLTFINDNIDPTSSISIIGTSPIIATLDGSEYTISLDTTGATDGQVLTFDGTDIIWETPNAPITDTNFAIDDLTFDASHTHDTLDFDLTITGELGTITIEKDNSLISIETDDINLQSPTTTVSEILNLKALPPTNVNGSPILVRDSVTGNVEVIAQSTLVYTDEQAQDAVFNALINSGSDTLTYTYDDASNEFFIESIEGSSIQKVGVAKNGTFVGARKRLNFIEGSNTTLTVIDNSINDRVDITINATANEGSGTVTSVALNSIPSFATATGSPITSSGTLGFSLDNQNANTVFAGPSTGSPNTPSFRSLVLADLPNLSETIDDRVAALLVAGANITLTYNDVANTLTIASSGGGGGGGTVDSVVAGTGISVDSTDPANPIVSSTITQYTDELAQDAVGLILLDNDTINFNYDDAAPNITASVITQMSITSDASGVKLVNDATTPANLQSYKTTILGTKGWANDFLQYDSSESVWSPYLVAHASKNIGGGFAENILIGKAAGQGLTTGHRITIVGSGSNGFILDDAEYVSIFGYANALANANGYGSTIIGCLNDDSTSGTFNTILGYNNLNSVLGNNGSAASNLIAGYGNAVELSGNGNVILGYENLTVGTSVSDSIIIGHNNGQGITTTDGIIIVGSNSGNGAALGIRTIILGTDAAPVSTGSENVIVGSNSATLLSSGVRNTLVGSGVGTYLTTGVLNVFIGRSSGGAVSTGSNNVFIGTGASADVSNSILIGANQNLNSSNIIGIGNGATDVYLGQNPYGSLSSLIYHGPRGQNTGLTDTAGNNWTFKGGAGSGTGLPGKIIFQTSDPIASGITVQTLTDTLSVEGGFVHIEKGLGLKVEVSSAASLTLSTKTTYVFTGSSATTWTLPAVSGNTDRTYLIKNRGTAVITLTRAGSDNIYSTALVTTFAINPGDAYQVINDGTYWLIL